MSEKVLIVEDSKVDQAIIKRILAGHDLLVANDGVEALAFVDKYDDIDIMILDLNMPRMNGFEVLEHLNLDYQDRDIAVLILTNFEEIENEILGLALGAVDFIRKPLNAESLKKRIDVHQNLIQVKKEIKRHNMQLEEIVKKRTRQLELSRDITINALISLLEIRDFESCNHTRRTQLMMKALSEYLSGKEKYSQILTQDKLAQVYRTAPLHDIGKVGVPDAILLKPGRLTEDEFDHMKKHVNFGSDALSQEFGDMEVDSYIETALNIITGHHEKFNGSGYPKGLSGKDIPIEGRMMAVIDVYDALTSERVYKEAFSHEKSIAMMKEDSGKHFDPDILQAFLEIEDAIIAISTKYNSKRGDDRCD